LLAGDGRIVRGNALLPWGYHGRRSCVDLPTADT
jgi:hypothetical protein